MTSVSVSNRRMNVRSASRASIATQADETRTKATPADIHSFEAIGRRRASGMATVLDETEGFPKPGDGVVPVEPCRLGPGHPRPCSARRMCASRTRTAALFRREVREKSKSLRGE